MKPGYKNTEIGVIPEDWEVKTLGTCVNFRTGPFGSMLHKSDYISGGTPVINPMHIFNQKIFPEHNMSVSSETLERMKDFTFILNDIAIGRRGEMGRCALITKEYAGWVCGTGTMIIRSNGSIFEKFLALILSSKMAIDFITQMSVGSTMINLNQGILSRLPIPLPPLSEQRAIASALSDIDALLAAQDRLIAKKRDLKTAAMQSLLSGDLRLPGFAGAWVEAAIQDVAKLCSEKNINEEDWPVLSCTKHRGFVESLNFFKSQVFSNDRRNYKTIKRGQIGYPANHIEEGSIGLQNICDIGVVSPIYVIFEVDPKTSTEFLYALLKSDAYKQKFQTRTNSSVDRRGSLRWPEFSKFKVLLPPLDEQRAIAQVLSDMDAEIEALEAQRDKTAQLKQGMMQTLLIGETRLV